MKEQENLVFINISILDNTSYAVDTEDVLQKDSEDKCEPFLHL